MFDRRLWRYFDYPLLIITIIVVTFGVAMIYSAAWQDPVIVRTPVSQAIAAMVGMLVLIALAIFDYSLLRGLSWWLYFGTLLALALVLVPGVGTRNFGAQRWFSLAGVEVQPAELAKLTLGIFTAQFIASREGRWPYLRVAATSFALILPCIGLILAQPNLSSAMIIAFMWLAIVFAGGLRRGDVATMIATGIGLVGLFIVLNTAVEQACILPSNPTQPATRDAATGADNCSGLLQDYQLKRVQNLFGVNTKLGDNYQSEQALIALAGGGIWGQGYLQGTQTQLRFLPVRHTDFIFSVIGEELGFAGALFIVLLLGLLIWRCMRAAWLTFDTFGRLICVSVAAVLFLQTYINLGMQVGLLPVTGVVLPFVSYGRTNLVTALIAVGLVESVAMRFKRLEFARR